MQTVSKFQELSKTFIDLKTQRVIHIFYNNKTIETGDFNKYNISTDIHNYIIIGKNRKSLNMMYGGVSPIFRVKDETAFSNIDYVNLMNIFKNDLIFLEKVINTLEKELLV